MTEGAAVVRWERLFADLDARWDEAERAALDAEVEDRTRREVARLRVVDRLRAAVGEDVTVHVGGAQVVTGRVSAVGADWLLLAVSATREALVPLAAVTGVVGLGPWAAEPGSEGAVGARLDLRHALRRLARDRAPVVVVLVDGGTLTGTLDRVGADFVELAEHALDEPRRESAVTGRRLVPLGALALVRSA